MKKYILPFFIFTFGFLVGADAISILSQESGLMVLEVRLDSVYVSESGEIKTIPAVQNQTIPGLPKIPAVSEVLIGVPSTASVDVFKDVEKSISDIQWTLQDNESAKGIEHTIQSNPWNGSVYPQTLIELYECDDIRGNVASHLIVYPCQYRDTMLTWWKEVTIQITWQSDQNTAAPGILGTQTLFNIPNNQSVSLHRNTNSIPAYQYSEYIAKITVDSTGWYAMTKEALADSGLSVNNIDPRTIRLWNKEEEIPLLIEGEEDGVFNSGDRIIFYGERLSAPDGVPYKYNFYTNDNVYWLTWGESFGTRYLIEGAYPSEDLPEFQKPIYFQDKNYIEKNDFFSRLGQVSSMLHHRWDEFDHFFMNPPVYNGTSTDYLVDIYFPASSSFSIDLEFKGITSGIHQIQIQLNGHLIGETEVWTGQSTHHFSIDVFEQDNIPLNNGQNTLTVINLEESGDGNNSYDMIYMNWFEVTYDRFFATNNDSLNIFIDDSWRNKNIEFSCDGYDDPSIYIFKDDFAYLTDFLVLEDIQNNKYNIVFQDVVGQNTSQYHVFSSDKLNRIKSIDVIEPISEILSDITSEYIAICPDSFKIALEPLVITEHNGTIVDINEVYRQYSYGILSPYAIKDFLQDVYSSNNRNLKNVLLGMQGGRTGLYGNTVGESGFIPSMRIQTIGWGAASSDYWYSCVEGDDIYGDFAIGRFPAKDITELSIHIDKTLNMINNDDDYWHNQMLMIAGYEETFKDQAETFIEPIIEKSYFPSRLYIDVTSETGPFFGGTSTLIQYLESGLTYVNFLGHGGGAVWGDRSILTLEALDYLNNGFRLPFITSMTCFTGDVTNPNGLGRQMLALDSGGAVGWFGSSGVGWIINDFLLLQPIVDKIVSDEDMTLGEMILQGKIEYASTNVSFPNHSITQIYQFNYSGDPALKLPKPSRGNYELDIADPEPGETIEIILDPMSTDSTFYQVYDEDNFPVNFSPIAVTDEGSFSYLIHDTLQSGNYRMNVSSKSNTDHYHSTIPLTLNGSFAAITEIIPQEPFISDTLYIIAAARDRQGIDSLKLYINNQLYANMINDEGDYYQHTNPILPYQFGGTLRLHLIAEDSQNNITVSPVYVLNLQEPPDFSPRSLEFMITDSVGLTAAIRNAISTPGDAKVTFERLNTQNSWETLDIDTLHFSGLQTLDAHINGSFDEGTHQYRVISQSMLNSSNSYNDTLIKTLTTNAFMVSEGSSIGIEGIECTVQNGSGLIHFENVSNVDHTFQPDFLIHQSDPLRSALKINSSENINYTVQWSLPQDTVSADFFKYYDETEIWLPYQNTRTDTSVNFTSSEEGYYAFFLTDDIIKPYTEATVNAQRFLNNSYVNKTPEIYISASDDNGLDFREYSIQCWSNSGDSISIEQMTGKGTSLGLRFKPTLSIVDSVLYFIINDASGNMSDTLDLHFIVKEHLELIDYGNFPNPFKNQTRFTYELTETVDKYQLNIYTVSGRKIRQLSSASALTDLDPKIGGFHEIVWNGRNDDGEFVANGVYFYKMTAKKGKTVIHKVGKVVKAR